ncbi:MAG: 3-keto-disaccharide hydrolase [Isosphaeraceae bacterium]
MIAIVTSVSMSLAVVGFSPPGDARASRPTRAQAEAQAPSPAPNWTPLFNGRDLTGWYTFLQKHGKNQDPDHVITIEDGAIHLYKDAPEASNVVMGYIATEKEYGNYHFRFQYRWGTKKFEPRYKLKRDAGLYYHILGKDQVWPRALQYQVEQTNVGDLIALYGMQLDTTIDPKTRSEKMPTFQPGEQGGEPYVQGGEGIAYLKHLAGDYERDGWNTSEIIARGDTTTHILNGQVVSKGTGIRLVDPEKKGPPQPVTRGRIALEIEAAEIYFRNVEIRLLGADAGRGE